MLNTEQKLAVQIQISPDGQLQIVKMPPNSETSQEQTCKLLLLNIYFFTYNFSSCVTFLIFKKTQFVLVKLNKLTYIILLQRKLFHLLKHLKHQMQAKRRKVDLKYHEFSHYKLFEGFISI